MKKIMRNNIWNLALAMICAVLHAIVFVGISILLQQIIDMALRGEIRKAAIVAVSYTVMSALVLFMQSLTEVRLKQKVAGEIRSTIVERLLRKNTLEFEKYKCSDYVSLVQNDVKKIEDSYVETVLSIVSSIVMLILSIVVMTGYSWVFTAVMFAMTALMFVVPSFFSRKMAAANQELSQAQEEMTEGLTEVVSGYEVIKSLQKEEYSKSKFGKYNQLLIRKAKKFGLVSKMNSSTSSTLMFTMQLVICVLAGYFIYVGKITYGSTVGVVQVSGSFCQPVFQLFALIPALKALVPIWEKIETYTEYADLAESLGEDEKEAWSCIRFENASFSYPNEDKKALDDITLSIEKGKKYLIVGESGAGKSTLINMICGNYIPQEGKITFDGKESRHAGDKLKENTAVVWQNIFLFNESIKENIMMGEEDTGKLRDSIREANLSQIIEEKGVDYIVGSDGNLLSGGQKQRIAIARALYADRDIIVLDEGISALDQETANEIEECLLSQKGRTLISISHHVSPEMRSRYDAVIELKEGKIA